ncbi:GAF and ANTAR domain-containing protein [Rhodococcus sp. NPDC058639]|uniref:GAF and ANTAR domain-containing protein n=1 Tax=Rhodococcus sp. NPDC058639 TaxID=3346570 RepID=UPI003661F24B
MNADSPPELVQLLGDLAIELQNESGPEATLRGITGGAVSLIPGAWGAGISKVEGRETTAEAPTNPTVAELDELQTALGEGPCLTALREHRTVHIEDMATETRWPRFARAAFGLGVRRMLSFQLFVVGDNLGALNLYGNDGIAFDEESRFVGSVLAQHASIAMIGASAQAQFDIALASRDIIGQAKGILMHREQLTGLQAFALLVKTSQNANIKLLEIARWVVDQHESGCLSA